MINIFKLKGPKKQQRNISYDIDDIAEFKYYKIRIRNSKKIPTAMRAFVAETSASISIRTRTI